MADETPRTPGGLVLKVKKKTRKGSQFNYNQAQRKSALLEACLAEQWHKADFVKGLAKGKAEKGMVARCALYAYYHAMPNERAFNEHSLVRALTGMITEHRSKQQQVRGCPVPCARLAV
jgi:hypothetical protein